NKRQPLLDAGKLGASPLEGALTGEELEKNNLPDVVARWRQRNDAELERARTERSFCVPKGDIVANGYDLSLNRYKQAAPPKDVVADSQYRDRAESVADPRMGGPGRLEIRRLDQIAQIFLGRADDMPVIDRQPEDDVQRFLPASALKAPLPEVEALPVSIVQASDDNRIRGGDLLGMAPAGRWLIAPDDYRGVQAGRGVVVIRLNQDVAPAEYVAEFLAHHCESGAFASNEDASSDVGRDIGLLDVPLPRGDQGALAGHASSLGDGFSYLQERLASLRERRASAFAAESPKQIADSLQTAARRSLLLKSALQRIEQPYQVIQDSYPYGIARAVRRFKNSVNPMERLEASLQCSESLIVSLGIFSLALAKKMAWDSIEKDGGKARRQDIGTWILSIENGGASLGHWIAVARTVGEEARRTGESASGLAGAVAKRRGGGGLIADLERIVKIRNEIRHGAAPRTRAEFEKRLDEIEPILRSGLEGSEFMAESQWVHTEKISWREREQIFGVSALSLMGDHPDFLGVEFLSGRPLPDERLYARSQDAQMVELSPFCVLQSCPSCLSPEIFYPDRLVGSTVRMKSLDRGHSLDSDEIAEDMRMWIHGVRKRSEWWFKKYLRESQ
ncbi:hypothetical protein ABH940_007395, partial [Streptacidiphilus sp. BW17]